MRFPASHGLAASLILLITLGCATSPHGETPSSAARQQQSASEPTRALPKVALLGVVIQDGIGKDILPGWIASELVRAGRAGGRRSMMGVGEARRSLGAQRYAALRANFKRSEPVAINDISGAAPSRPPANYGVILRVDRDTIAREVVSREAVGDGRDGRENVTVKTERELGVAVLLIDLDRSREVWLRRYDHVARTELDDVPFRPRATSQLFSDDSALRGPPAGAYPKVPRARDMLRKILRDAARDLPAR